MCAVGEIVPCLGLNVSPLLYSAIGVKVYTELQKKLCGDELLNGNALTSTSCAQLVGIEYYELCVNAFCAGIMRHKKKYGLEQITL
jgi:hypothetical protein